MTARFFSWRYFGQVLRFGIIGAAAAVIDYGVYYMLFPITGIIISKAVSYVLATFFTFIMNKLWTFGAKAYSRSEIVRFISLYALSIFINNIVNKAVFSLSKEKLAGFLAATAICAAVNFFGLKYFVFRKN